MGGFIANTNWTISFGRSCTVFIQMNDRMQIFFTVNACKNYGIQSIERAKPKGD